MSNVASYARGLGLDYIVFNPGTLTTAAAYYAAADLIVNEEIYYSSYSESSTVDTIPSEYRGQSAIILHDTPSSADNCLVAGLYLVFPGKRVNDVRL